MSELKLNPYFGEYGGMFVPQLLVPALKQLEAAFVEAQQDPAFLAEFQQLLTEYAGRPTPLTLCRNISPNPLVKIYLKREDLQQVRSYKIRGAYNKISTLDPEEQEQGVICASAGNHALGVAYSCKLLQIKGKIYMPKTTPKQKVKQVNLFGGTFVEIVLTGDTFDDAYSAALEDATTNKLTFIHPFDDEKVIAGQGTVGLEILESFKEPIDYVFVPIGGGGLISGIAIAARART